MVTGGGETISSVESPDVKLEKGDGVAPGVGGSASSSGAVLLFGGSGASEVTAARDGAGSAVSCGRGATAISGGGASDLSTFSKLSSSRGAGAGRVGVVCVGSGADTGAESESG